MQTTNLTTVPDQMTLLLRCHTLPADSGLRLGVQQGHEVVEDVPPGTTQVTFRVPLGVRRAGRRGAVPGDAGDDGEWDFFGSFVHGKAGDRFVYLSWGTRDAAGAWVIHFRAKFPLRYLGSARVRAALSTGEPITIAVEMTGPKGGPLCATIPHEYLT